MHIDYLVRMANDIGEFFASEADPNVAADSIHLHLKRFWDPRMRASIVAYFNETGGIELEGPVRTAVQRLAEETAAKALPT
jgi:formate dehydrogenase subunit delta